MGIRTDLALEAREMYCEEYGKSIKKMENGEKYKGENESESKKNEEEIEIPGVRVDTVMPADGVSVTRIEIFEHPGEVLMGKPFGNYITVETEDILSCSKKQRERLTDALAEELRRLIPFDSGLKVLVVGLGNEKITPDSLGPATVEKVRITRHYFVMLEEESDDKVSCVSGLCPGVMGTTGIESADLIKKAAQISKPDVIIAIDALAARSIERVNTTIQISDAGIEPGSGTGNMRKALNRETTGARVIAIGIPTVIDAKTIIMDTMEKLGKGVRDIEKKIDNEKLSMIVTSSEIDLVINDFSCIIADALNMTLHPGLYSDA